MSININSFNLLSEVQESICKNISDTRIKACVRARIASVWNSQLDVQHNLNAAIQAVRGLGDEIRSSCSDLAEKTQSIL